MFTRKEDYHAFRSMINEAAKAKSGAQQRCFQYIDEALLDEIPLRNEKGEIQYTKDEKTNIKQPIMKTNTILNRVTALIKLATHSSRFRHVNSRYLQVITNAKKHAERLMNEGEERDYYVRKIESQIRSRIALVCKELNININELSSMIPGIVDTAIKSEEKDLGLL